MTVKLTTPCVRVVLESEPDKTLTIQTTNRDLVLWDRTRLKHKWPAFEDAPFLWMTFISWAAARRSGLIPLDTTYEKWESDVMSADASEPEPDDEMGRPFPDGEPSAAHRGDSDSDTHEP
jgi:hypothetical protein